MSNYAAKIKYWILKIKYQKLNVYKLVPVPADLSNLSHIVKNDVVKKTAFDKLVAKVNSIDTNAFVLKNNYHRDKSEI